MRETDLQDVLAIESGATLAQLKEELGRAWASIRVAREDGGRAVGFILTWHVADEIHVLNIAVRRDCRRRGVGRALMQDLLTDARRRKMACIFLEVRQSNEPAIALYRSHGFRSVRVRQRYYPDNEDALEMTLALGAV